MYDKPQELTSTQADVIELAEGLRLPLEIVTSTLGVLANRGAGKSAFTHLLVERMYDAGLPVVVIDVKGDWWGIRSSADGKGPGLPFVIFGGDHGDVPLEPTAGELLANLIVDDRIPSVLDLSHMSKASARRFATSFAEHLYQRNRDPLMVVIEEADVLIPQRASADTARLIGAMEDLAKRGRNRGIGLVTVSQRPQETAKAVLDLMETVVLLRITGPRSIKAVQEWISVNADQSETTTRDIVGSLPSLDTGEAWVWSPGFLRLLIRTRFPLFRTFDSHATPKPGQARVVPKARADIDLDRLGQEIAATRARANDNDPTMLRAASELLRRQLAEVETRAADAQTREARTLALVEDRDHEIENLRRRIAELEDQRDDSRSDDTLKTAITLIENVLTSLTGIQTVSASRTPSTSPAHPRPLPPGTAKRTSTPCTPAPQKLPPAEASAPQFRKGAHRMIESLARMAPLRLTKAQWGTVARIKHTGGTWSTYLGELRRAGLVDEDAAGYTLTQAGWDYLGTRPKPMTAQELQQHYLGILRAGASRMLQACIDAYPDSLTKDALAEAAGISAAGGTFSTYLGELRRNGLVQQRGDSITATDILVRGAASG